MYQNQRKEQKDVIQRFLGELFERGGTEDDVFELLTNSTEFNHELPIQWVFKHHPTGETLYFLVDSENLLATMGVKITGRDTDHLEKPERICFSLFWLNESDGSIENLSSVDLQSLQSLNERERRSKLQGLFNVAGRILREKLDSK